MDGLGQIFRREHGRLVATLTRIFGLHNLALAEDVVQDAFLRAAEVWRYRGVPAEPAAWLLVAAKRRALDALRRERTARTFAPELERLLESEWTAAPTLAQEFGATAIKDDLLRMMFTCCQPRLAEEARVALILNILCGFGIEEIAGAFVSTRTAIEKRVTRAKKVLAESKLLFDVTAAGDFAARVPSVLRSLYLLFSEGYHGASAQAAVRAELCREAMRLTAAVLEHPFGAVPATYALAALMCFDAARLPGRLDESGALCTLAEQDRSKWDRALINEGAILLERSASGRELSEYHVEAAIASIHSRAARIEDTDWRMVVSLYDQLMALKASPIVALNRSIAVAQAEGADRGIEELLSIPDAARLARYPFYPAALGECELRRGNAAVAREYFLAARALARNATERAFLDGRIQHCSPRTVGQPAVRAAV